MGGEFRLHHGSATIEKAAAAAGRVEAIVGDVVNGNRKAWGRIDVEDIALLVQHARDAAASPDWLSKMAIDALVTRWETAKAERAAAIARAEAAEQRAEAVVADAQAAAHFAQSVAHLLASPGAEAAAVQHLRADDLPHLLDCLRERLAEQRVEALAAEVARLRADRAVLSSALVVSWPDELNDATFPTDPEPVLGVIRAEALKAIAIPNHDGIELYLREMFARIEAEAQPAEVPNV